MHVPHWIYLICGLGQVLLFGISYLLGSVVIQSAMGISFFPGADKHFTATLTLFTLGAIFQWLITNILKGAFRYGIAILNLSLLAFIIFHRVRLYHSLLLLACSILSVAIILVTYERLQREDPPEPLEESDLLDDDW